MSYEDAVWEKIQSLMPRCPSCHGPRSPGAIGDQHILFCGTCSDFAVVDPEWVDQVVAQAYAEVDGGLKP